MVCLDGTLGTVLTLLLALRQRRSSEATWLRREPDGADREAGLTRTTVVFSTSTPTSTLDGDRDGAGGIGINIKIEP